jgi:hypothetical protein
MTAAGSPHPRGNPAADFAQYLVRWAVPGSNQSTPSLSIAAVNSQVQSDQAAGDPKGKDAALARRQERRRAQITASTPVPATARGRSSARMNSQRPTSRCEFADDVERLAIHADRTRWLRTVHPRLYRLPQHSALRDGGDDGFVFAYRALEDVARAVSGQTDQLHAGDWAQLHQLLDTTSAAFLSRIEPLHDARRAASHGNESDPKVQAARANRGAVIAIGRRVVAEALEHAGLPLRVANLR